MPRPLVSVVIPVYQGSRFIAQTLASVLDQTWPDLEIIVVDDGSTDASVDRIRAFADSRIQLVQACNGGASRARNIGWQRSRGEFIQFLDHDDTLHPRKIEVQIHRLMASADGCVACASWESFDIHESDSRRVPQPLWRDDDPFEWLLSARGGEGIMPTGAWLLPRTVLERVDGWDETLERNPDDDGEFFSRVVLASRRVLFCEGAVFYYRNAGAGNLRMSRSETSVRSLFRTQELYEQRMRAVEDSPRVRSIAAYGYASFLEMIYPEFPALCAAATSALARLDACGHRSPGSPSFARLADAIGLQAALRLRRGLRLLFGRPLLGGAFTARSIRRRKIALRRLLSS